MNKHFLNHVIVVYRTRLASHSQNANAIAITFPRNGLHLSSFENVEVLDCITLYLLLFAVSCVWSHNLLAISLDMPHLGHSSMEESHSIVRRSRAGCAECRRRRRRCDERKPGCSYCRSVQKECSYAQQLSWGGRPFPRSRFGSCLTKGNGVVKIPSSVSSSIIGEAF